MHIVHKAAVGQKALLIFFFMDILDYIKFDILIFQSNSNHKILSVKKYILNSKW